MTATVLVVEDDCQFREALCDTLRFAGFEVRGVSSGESALRLCAEQDVGLVISDIQMGGMDGLSLLSELKDRIGVPVLLMTAYGTVAQAVEAMREGAEDYLLKPFEVEVLVAKVSRHFRPEITANTEPSLVVCDPKSVKLKHLAERVARSPVSVMITGPSGSGKEVLARYIHQCSGYRGGPFIAINCAAIPDNMLEAMLFGYEKGAFTGAHKACPGKFEMANHGTLLLDEISEMDLGLQAKLLRVLQEREVERLGGREPVKLDVRVVATSNRDIRAAVNDGDFREDLFYRVNVFPLVIAPLEQRIEDIVPLAEHLLAAASADSDNMPALSDSARSSLKAHKWPGNVRELDNVIQRALVLCSSREITTNDLIFEDAAPGVCDPEVPIDSIADELEPERLNGELRVRENRLILDALKSGMGSRKIAAEQLGISPRTLRYKLARMRKEGIEIPSIRA